MEGERSPRRTPALNARTRKTPQSRDERWSKWEREITKQEINAGSWLERVEIVQLQLEVHTIPT